MSNSSPEALPSNPSSNATTPGLMVKTAADIGKAVTRFPGLGKDLFVLKTAYDVLAAENERLRAALENASRRSEYWKAEHAEANRAIEGLEARLAPETPVLAWQPIATCPKEVSYLLADDGTSITYIGYWNSVHAGWFDQCGERRNPTHWQQRPAPPGYEVTTGAQ